MQKSYERDPQTLADIQSRALDPQRRFVGDYKDGHNSKWSPETVIDPSTNQPFTNTSAWEFLAQQVANNHAILRVKLITPPGKEGHELKVALNSHTTLYIKVHLTKKTIIGRSFHLSGHDG